MEMSDYPSWRWGLSLIALTLAFHAVAEPQLQNLTHNLRGGLCANPANELRGPICNLSRYDTIRREVIFRERPRWRRWTTRAGVGACHSSR